MVILNAYRAVVTDSRRACAHLAWRRAGMSDGRTKPRYLSSQGELVAYDDANVHVLSTAFKYAATVYEGIRA